MHEDGQAYRMILIGTLRRCENTYKEGCKTDYVAQ
jgi:hypothetical protein